MTYNTVRCNLIYNNIILIQYKLCRSNVYSIDVGHGLLEY